MSNFQRMARHPITGEMQLADWLDLGERYYVVRFPDGQRFCETEIACEASNCQGILNSSNTALTDCLGAFEDNPIQCGE